MNVNKKMVVKIIVLKQAFSICCEKSGNRFHCGIKKRIVVDEIRTLQLPEIPLLIKIYRKRDMGWQISLDEPILNKFTRTNKSVNQQHPNYNYII